MGIGRVLVADRSPVPIIVSGSIEAITFVWERDSERLRWGAVSFAQAELEEGSSANLGAYHSQLDFDRSSAHLDSSQRDRKFEKYIPRSDRSMSMRAKPFKPCVHFVATYYARTGPVFYSTLHCPYSGIFQTAKLRLPVVS